MKKFLLFTCLFSIALTQAQVSLVKDINPGAGDGVTDQFINYNNLLLFTANNVTDGFEIWTSDGTTSGTNFITSGNSAYNPENFYHSTITDEIFYSAGGSFKSLYKTNGTLSGTQSISGNIIESSGYIEFNNKLFFTAKLLNSTQSVGRQLCVSEGATSNTGLFKFNGGQPRALATYNGRLYFSDYGSAQDGYELWVSDGTVAGTNMLVNINTTATNFGHSYPIHLTVFNNKLYFSADNGTNGRELWVTDGTVSGTNLVLDINSGSVGSNPENLTVFNNALYFTATHPTFGTEVFKMTAAENITNLKNIAPVNGVSSNPSDLFISNGKLYFSADDNTNGRELWSSTGFSSTTNMVKDINTSPATPDSNPSSFAEYNGKLYFVANNDTNGRELWVTDGTNAGTVLVDDINTSGDSNPSDLIVANNLLFFSATTPVTGKELFKYQDPALSIDNVELEASVSLFPNPTKNKFSIETNHVIRNITVHDIQGKIVKPFKENLAFYGVEDLTSGLYFVKIDKDNGSITKKLIKE
jgi:ELWxxDGT repeat protein